MEQSQEKIICGSCGSEDAFLCVDPYMLEIHEEHIIISLCHECYLKYCDEI